MKKQQVIPIELRASNAHRWMTCHGQPRAVAGMVESSSSAADKGTVAHALLETMLRLDLPSDEIDQFADKPMLKTLGEGKTLRRVDHIIVDEEMMKGVSHAIDYVRSYLALNKEADYEVEVALDASSLVGYETGGTSDIVITDLPREIAVLDYKNGVQFVDHSDNEQLHIYGLGAIAKYVAEVTPKTSIRMVIIQPNNRDGGGPVREVVYTYDDLMLFARKAAAAAKAAHGKNPARVAGEHCTFCRAGGMCKTFAEYTLNSAGFDFADVQQGGDMSVRDARNMDPEEMAQVLAAKSVLVRWLDNVEAEAIRLMSHNTKIPGFKLVSSRPHRRWDDPEAIVKTVLKQKNQALLDELCPRTPLTPNRIEQRLSRKRDGNPKLLQKLVSHVTHNPIEPRVAPEDSARPLFDPAADFREDE